MLRSLHQSIAIAAIMLAAPVFGTESGASSDSEGETMTDEAFRLSEEQQAIYDSWDTDRQGQHDSWSVQVRTYYWTLEPWQEPLFWQLSDSTKSRLEAADIFDRSAMWHNIEKTLVLGIR